MNVMFLIFSFIFLAIFTAANFYIYKRLFMQIAFFRAHKAWVWAFFAVIFAMQGAFLLFRADDRFSNPIYNTLAHSFAFTYFFCAITLFADILRFGVKIYTQKLCKSSFDEKRRQSIKVLFNFALLFFAIGSMLQGCSNAMNVPNVRKYTLRLKKLRENTRLVMVSDIHLGKNLHEKFLRGLVDKINALKPDVVAIVGDLIDTKPHEIEPYIHLLDEIQSKYGVFYALGNHEYYRGLDGVLELLGRTKMKILINKSVNLPFLNIGGLADLAGLRAFGGKMLGAKPDIEATKADLDPQKPSILLSHQPKSVKLYDTSAFELVLSGHTHGGQVFPFGAIVFAQQGFLHGFYELDTKNTLYVSSGAGFWGPAMRFLAPSEIVCIDLEAENG